MKLKLFYILTVLAILSTSGCSTKADKKSAVESPKNSSNPPAFVRHDELAKARLFNPDRGHGHIKLEPISEIEWTDAKEVVNVRFDDPIMSFRVDDQLYVIPWYVIKNYHVGNLSIQGVRVVITLCEVCSGSSVFKSDFEGVKKTFRLGGYYNGTNCMVDEFGDIWGTFSGEAYTGPNKGKELERIHSFQTLWADWIKQFKDFKVADYPEKFRRGHNPDARIGETLLKPTFIQSLENDLDERLVAHTMVQGVKIQNSSRAYEHSLISEKGVINDTLLSSPIVIMSKGESSIVSVYGRMVNNKTLEFAIKGGNIIDKETYSIWSVEGKAISGELKGTSLPYIDNQHKEWYAWAAYNPNTTIFNNANIHEKK